MIERFVFGSAGRLPGRGRFTFIHTQRENGMKNLIIRTIRFRALYVGDGETGVVVNVHVMITREWQVECFFMFQLNVSRPSIPLTEKGQSR